MAVFRKPRRAGKAGASAKKPTKKQNLVSKQKSSMKKTMRSAQRDREGKSSQQRTKKAWPEKIQNRDGTEAPALATTPKVGFMDLSGELRNQIYREVLHFEGAIMIGQKGQSCDRDASWGGDSGIKTPSLLQISSQIRKEAISIYYSENTFLYTGGQDHRVCTAVRFQKWCEHMGAENVKWIKKLQIKFGLCWTCNPSISPWWPSPMCDIYPYVEFAVKHPNCELELAELRPSPSFHTNCHCCPGAVIDLVLFSERIPIIKELAWVEEIAAGNIVKIRANTGWNVRVDEVIYAREASNRTNRENKWQELCDKLSLNYAFDLKPESGRGGMRFMMQVQKSLMPDADMVDSV